jgi:alcohol dehydrogenase
MRNYALGRVPQIFGGPDALKQLPGLIAASGANSVAVIADAAVEGNGFLERLTAVLPDIQTFIVAPGEPTCAETNRAADFARMLSHPLILGVGGGSALDIAKQVAAVIRAPEGIEHYLLCANPFAGRAPLITVPTTSGTGAEVTRTCVVSDDAGRKLWTWGEELLPDAVILDPAVTASMPPFVTAATGLDALVHAIEAATSGRHNEVARASALQAVRLIRQALPKAVQDGSDLTARQQMQEAALLAGIAIDNCGTGVAHCIGHALGTLYHLPHGVAVTVALEAALPWNIGESAAYEGVALAFGVSVPELPAAFSALLDATGLNEAVRRAPEVQIDPAQLAVLMRAPENLPMLSNNARLAQPSDDLQLAEQTARLWAARLGTVRRDVPAHA